jgi:predicted CXXCH cytochrome family protein
MGASAAMATIANSKHDLTNANTAQGVIKTTTTGANAISSCQFCHTPHRADTSVTNAPLWNRNMSTLPTYTVYGGGTTGQTLGATAVAQPGSNSKTCLSCHDGTLSIGNVIVGGAQAFTTVAGVITGGRLDPANVNNITGSNNNLANDHPIGVIVASGGGVAGLDTLASMVTNSFKFYGASRNVMECATCHDPHGVGTNSFFLRRPSGQLCSLCHVNK